MATETTKTEQKDTSAADAPEDKRPAEAGADAAKERGTDKDTVTGKDKAESAAVAHDDEDAFDDAPADERPLAGTAAVKRGGAVGAGAGAIVSAALGLCSLTGTSVSEMLRDRKQLIGQIESQSQGQSGGSPSSQIDSLYGAPWHATALFNSIFAILAVIVGGVLLAVVSKRAETNSWVKAVALSGVILGVIGLLIAGGMYFDVIAGAPKLPGAPS